MQLAPLHEKSHWVSPRICIGAKPLENFFWFLTAPDYDQKKWYIISLVNCKINIPAQYSDIKVWSFPIEKNNNSQGESDINVLIDFIENRLIEGYYIYLHCQGGIGRSNMIAAIIIGRQNKWDLSTTIDFLKKCRKSRPYKGKDFVPILEYPEQEAIVAKYLSGPKGIRALDHSDRSWTSKLMKQRKSEIPRVIHSEILFFGEKKKWGVFSNFYPSEIKISGKTYPTVEHYFQSRKFSYKNASKRSKEYGELIRKSKSPGIAKMLAGQKKSYRFPWMKEVSDTIERYKDVKMRSGWEEIKESIMMVGLYYKFSDKALKKQLMDTGYSVIIENSPYDSYWGIGKDGRGRNRLGVCLMYLRSYFLERN